MISSASRALFSVVLIGICVAVCLAQEVETIKTDTNLVTVPVIVTSINGLYITDLTKDEFKIMEDGAPHEIAFFGKIAAPFHVILLLDTSSSTKDNLRQIQNAAFAFVQQLQPADRVKIISFDDEVRDLNEFTSNRETLRTAINSIRSGNGTKVYDAFEIALNNVRRIQGRKAIVLFSDGMDWHSDNATFSGTLRNLDEEGVIVYPIRYETRATTEAIAREQQGRMTPTLPTREVIQRPPAGTTAPTFPGGEPIPTTGTQQRTGPFGLPLPDEIMRRRRETERRDRDRDRRYPEPGDREQIPGSMPPDDRVPPEQRVPDRRRIPGQQDPPATTTTSRRRGPDDEITRMLDMAYSKADDYLKALAEKSGGRLMRADTLASLPEAFGQIAAELRTQYLLGYYPLDKTHDERYRRIKVQTTRKDVMIRARPGYVSTGAK
ncbi:MAG TPA: VWA domain-containing protein [Pyrinomonadaceae bacterium]|nr:VWA domain-containing protein [Pyrinomonadaceae bacterium]